MNILIVDDEKKTCSVLAEFIRKIKDCFSFEAYNGVHALEIINSTSIDLVISDIKMPELDGISLARKLLEDKKNIDIILMSGQNDVIESINSLEIGVLDFLVKPIDIFKLEKILIKLKAQKKNKEFDIKKKQINQTEEIDIDNYQLKDFSIPINNNDELFAASESMKNIIIKILKLHQYPEIPILIEGETGTGKEKIAGLIHYAGADNNKPYVAINCAAISKSLFESELFGYEKGSFTGSLSGGSDGKIKFADQGTLFLDEISEIPLDMQAKLLRVLQEKEYYKVGGLKKETVNTRIIASTNRKLEDEIISGNFRKDLYYRLNICKIILPPLNKRKEDIYPLVISFIKAINKTRKDKIKIIHKDVFELMEHVDWSGNIRELKNAVIKATLFNENDFLSRKDFEFLDFTKEKKRTVMIEPDNFDLPEKSFRINDYINNIIKKALELFDGNITQTAEYLGLKRAQFYYRYKNLISTSKFSDNNMSENRHQNKKKS